MTVADSLKIARFHGLEREFWLSYREYKPWWTFWVSEAEAVAEALIDLDLWERANTEVVMTTCNWPISPSQTVEFGIYSKNEGWYAVPGVYIFTFEEVGVGWHPLYVGQTDDFSARLPSHERLNEAIQLGATHIHTRVVNSQQERDSLERALIHQLRPPMNSQFL